jgi:ketosteroid isomerase-like protein
MTEERIANLMREFVGTMGTEDVDKALSYFTDDATWVTPNGTFRGQAELRHCLTQMAQSMQDMTVTESGNGIIVQGNKAFFEHVIAGTMEGKRGEVLAMCAYEFSGEKIQAVRTAWDRLTMADQMAKGLIPRWMVGMIVKKVEKAFR